MRVVCPECGKTLAIPESAAGKSGACGGCGARLTIPIVFREAGGSGRDSDFDFDFEAGGGRKGGAPGAEAGVGVGAGAGAGADRRVGGYVGKSMQPGEVVAATGRLHWTTFLDAIVLWIAAAVFGGTLAWAASNRDAPAFLIPAIALAVAAVARTVGAVITYCTTEIVVTNRRVAHKIGFVARRTREMLISKVETAGVQQGILDRILNAGTVTVTGSGGNALVIRHLADPIGFRKAIQEQLEG